MPTEVNKTPYLIYNLFPRLTGHIQSWNEHLDRIARMGFNWIYINPFHYPGFSGSLYAVKDYFGFHPLMYDESAVSSPKNDLIQFIKQANKLGIDVMADLVINHTAIDSNLTKTHPQWYKYENGKIKNPCAKDGDQVVAVWGDLAEIDNENSPDKNALWQFWLEVADYLIELGFTGLRCDAAYQVPAQLWQYLIAQTKAKTPKLIYFGETLGCDPSDTITLIDAGFDVIFNSSKYWDFTEPWCIQQYNQTRLRAPSISFAESHDTNRLAYDTKNNWDKVKSRYLFSTIFSAGVMIPVGFEFGFTKKLDVVHTTPQDWEDIHINLTDYIAKCNTIKKDNPLFHFDSPSEIIEQENPHVFVLKKQYGTDCAIFILNKTGYPSQHVRLTSLNSLFNGFDSVKDISPEQADNPVPDPLECSLNPYQSKLFYACCR